MKRVTQSPTDDAFVQDPYPFYDRIRPLGPLVWVGGLRHARRRSHATVAALLRDKRFGRENPLGLSYPDHLGAVLQGRGPFHAGAGTTPPHPPCRGLVLRAFTSRRIAALEPEITQLCHDLIDAFPEHAPSTCLNITPKSCPSLSSRGSLASPKTWPRSCCHGPTPWSACTRPPAPARMRTPPSKPHKTSPPS